MMVTLNRQVQLPVTSIPIHHSPIIVKISVVHYELLAASLNKTRINEQEKQWMLSRLSMH
jgi:hypothetical protein